MNYNDDPRLVSVTGKVAELEQQVDDIIWDHGVNDPRLTFLMGELKRYRELEERGEQYEPKF